MYCKNFIWIEKKRKSFVVKDFVFLKSKILFYVQKLE